jgi:Right handed beta helix region
MAGPRRLAGIILAAAAIGTVAVTIVGCDGGGTRALTPASLTRLSSSGVIQAPPKTPPARICGNKSALSGPATMPAGAIRVPAGNNANVNFQRPNKTYWFAPGVHTLGAGEYTNIDPSNGDTYVGAPHAILDGRHANDSAFDDTAEHVVIKYLTIRNFGTWGGGQQEGVVNHDSGAYWTITHSTIIGNAGAGVMLGSHDVLTWNCIQNNQQYGFNAYSNSGEIVDLWLDHNEIINNDTYNYEMRYDGCGCSGGGKFWNVINARVTDNWVVDNKSVGLWADTDNAGFEFVGNYIQNSQGVGLQYEISYNGLIEYNTFIHDGAGPGSANAGFPTSAIYISESGSDDRVNTDYKNRFLIAHNNFLNNWGGVILWENSNRFCGSPDNTSTGYCTMVNPKATVKTCSTPALVKTQPYFSDCRWKTKNVLVEDNTFTFSPSAVGKACTPANDCGYNGVFSEYGSDPSWSPYQGDVVPTNITFRQNNVFAANTYKGPWCFMGWQLGTSVGFSQWRAAASVGRAQFGQDAKSTHTGASRACS